MTRAPDVRVVVVGAGAVGLSAGLELARRGAAVTVIEADAPAAGSTGLSVGVVNTQQLDPLEIELRVLGMRRFAELERHGLAVHRIGYARLARSTAAMEAFARSAEIQRALGVADVQVLDRAALARLVPDMRCDDLEGALLGAADGFVDGHLLCGLCAELLVAAGGELRTRCRLLGAARGPDGLLLETSTGRLACDVVVNAAGPWAGRVADLLGGLLPLRPERHQAVAVELARPLPYTMPMVMDYVPGLGGSGLNFRHERPGQLISEVHVACSAEPEDPDGYRRGIDDEALEGIAALLLERLPSLADAGLGRGWAGLYPMSADGRPYVGPTADPAVIAAAGAGGYGIQLSPALGMLAADWVLDGAPTTLPAAAVLVPTRLDAPPGR